MFYRRIVIPKIVLLTMIFSGIVQSIAAQSILGIDNLVEPGSAECIATDFRFTEGPVWHPNGYLLFSDIIGNTIYKWTPDGQVTVFRSPSGHANGLTLDSQGRLIACEHSNRRVSRTEIDGTIATLADSYNGKKLNSPNDVVVKSDGSIYFTDPPYGLDAVMGIAAKQELSFSGVYRITPDSKNIQLLVDDASPNGLAFSPDEKMLYIPNDMNSGLVVFDVLPDGTLGKRRQLANLHGWTDGMKIDMLGNLYIATGYFDIKIYDKNGAPLGKIYIPEATTNCAFGGPENKTLFVTAGSSVYRVQMKVQGALAESIPQL